MADLEIAEIPYDSGEIRFRYARYLSVDGSRWVRHGLFFAYHSNGQLASEGNYLDGVEHGHWKDFHDNGQLAAEGDYQHGQEVGEWKFWKPDGSPDHSRGQLPS
jgi:antitoxin component YwqK of YwqJK toxin-antitoxin module